MYSSRFSNYVADLKKYVSNEIIDKYSSGVTSIIGYVGEKLAALVSNYLIYTKYRKKL